MLLVIDFKLLPRRHFFVRLRASKINQGRVMFFIIWQGWGVLSILIPLLCMVPFAGLFNGLGLGVGLLVGAAVNAYIGHKLNNQPGKTYIDKNTGGEVIFRKKHTLFYVPMQYVSVLWAVVGVFALFSAL
ncbi:hypothetical protein C1Y08_13985 [Pseudomonas sp. FW306-02-F02-AA]|uniref:Transmembrane protein n=1 Tax=Pseudomonas fluorescens TaxID=294 RepID=A0A0N9VXD9_PSEFL|nr:MULTISPECIES: hypothetical protein [Pseudomonas]ALI03417.1 hypothetical protein AO353_20970 [Pseudomonas fluorescens]PMZ03557.1 hypothetical protein C1Y07_14710 [Pseudomonas sp. FW306-02-F02-AB]PMZ09712.1 hypothetical protein C1Y06_13365 [Pseudomonas sp. FW306-02-H06C]PMZ15451.1 hypothetical protein C1Y08_13985 [Pseudomonas sp. FW306-02-F02-AA]PMZ21221.1 hypothetical protein C1Y09_15435 [Pseudomonas sp. FW306-02-F08-AA]